MKQLEVRNLYKDTQMKIIKFLTAIPLFWLMIIFIGEVYVWNLESFETGETYVTFYLNEPEAEEKMKA